MSAERLAFILGIHSHQPLGNFAWVVRGAFEKAYRPFIEVVRAHPQFRFTLHYSGFLWEWIEKEAPWFMDMIGEMVHRGQLEIQIGGFYEPVLSAIPSRDRIGQVELSKEFVRARFGVEPQGLWLTERVWEPQIMSDLIDAGITYVVVDDYHFISAGLDEAELNGYYLMEEEGRTLAVFPISERLRYLVPFRPIGHVMEYLEEVSRRGGAAILEDDGEKFGVWPGTHRWVYSERWLEEFLTSVEEATWLESLTFSQFMNRYHPKGRVYLPTASYFEMGEWALPATRALAFREMVEAFKRRGEWESVRPFFRGGMWKNFLVKYPEANYMHKRMVWVSKALAEGSREAKRALYRAQCNDAYWHGIFGGIYLPHLRRAVYSSLLEAEEKGRGNLEGRWFEDIDGDGKVEIIYSNRDYLAVVKPARGGQLVEFSLRADRINITDTLARRFEHYHKGISGEGVKEGTPSIHERQKLPSGLRMIYDRYKKYSFIDHVLAKGMGIDRWEKGDWLEEHYSWSFPYSIEGQDVPTLLWEENHLSIQKRYLLRENGLEVNYRLASNLKRPLRFGIELNLLLPSAHNGRIRVNGEEEAATNKRDWGEAVGLTCIDPILTRPLEVFWDEGLILWQVPFFTLSQSEGGFDNIYQGTGLMVIWEGVLEGGKEIHFLLSQGGENV